MSKAKVNAILYVPLLVHSTPIIVLLIIQGWAVYRNKNGIVTMFFALLLILSSIFGIVQYSVFHPEFVSIRWETTFERVYSFSFLDLHKRWCQRTKRTLNSLDGRNVYFFLPHG